MGKKYYVDGYYVRVEVQSYFHPDQQEVAGWMKTDAEKMVEQIKRHVDDVGNVTVEADGEYVCEHCGSKWTEGNSPYNGGCCDEDEKAHLPQEEVMR